jgi:hypothetical protein
VEADAQFNPLRFRDLVVAVAHSLLDAESGTKRKHSARKLRQQTVAHHFEYAPAVLSNEGIGDFPAQFAELR